MLITGTCGVAGYGVIGADRAVERTEHAGDSAGQPLNRLFERHRLRQWYGHNPGRFEEFARRYRAELDEPERAAAYSQLRELAAHGPLTLLTAAKRSDISEAAVLAGPLKKNASR